MEIKSVLVLGGSGFVGRHLCQQLAALGYRVLVPTRARERVKNLSVLPTVELVNADVHDASTLTALVRRCDAVVNAVGVLHNGRGANSFAAAHVGLAQKLVDACQTTGVRRVIQISAIGADLAAPSAYLRSKAEAEQILRGAGLALTVFRPSVIFGPEDQFLNLFASLQRFLPVLFLACPRARFQPVYVADVAAAIGHALADATSSHQCYDLAGPQQYTLRELVAYVGALTGFPRPIIGLGRYLSYLQAWLMELLPVQLMTRDNVRSMQVASISDTVFPFGMKPQALEALAPQWLQSNSPRDRYQRMRLKAGR
jgi:NADH dehydrogenase